LEAELILKLDNISKIFGATRAVTDLSMDMFKGDIIGLVGENGAGKSTLMKIVGGEYIPNSGTIEYKKVKKKWKHSSEALKQGIAIVHQHPLLVEDFSAEENIFLGKESVGIASLIDDMKIKERARTLLDKYSIVKDLDLTRKVSSFSAGEKQIIEILKAFSYDPDILILDEPTASLPKDEASRLLSFIKEMNQDNQISIIFISHKLEETFEICNKIMVMRNGENRGILVSEEFDKNRIIEMMINSSLDNFYPEKGNFIRKSVVLSMDSVSNHRIKNISLNVREGEIVGLYGLMGAGMTDIANILFGKDSITTGQIKFKDELLDLKNTGNIKKMIDRGVFLIPQDRLANGVFHSFSVRENTSIAHIDSISDSPVINDRSEKVKITETLKSLKVKYSSIDQSINELSGGNQQKVIISRWLLKKCNLLIMDDPTVGIDISAKKDIYNLLKELASQGIAIILISSEINEIIGMSDRIYTMRRGNISAELSGSQITQKNILENIL